MDIPPEIQSIVERFETSGLNFDKTINANITYHADAVLSSSSLLLAGGWGFVGMFAIWSLWSAFYVESKVDTSPKELLLVKGQRFAVNG